MKKTLQNTLPVVPACNTIIYILIMTWSHLWNYIQKRIEVVSCSEDLIEVLEGFLNQERTD